MIVLFIAVCLGTIVVCAQDGPVVDTSYGALQGSSKTLHDGRLYDAFLGVPYAAPAIGALRWSRPQPPQPWDGVRDASQYGSYCVQVLTYFYPLIGISSNHSEDCLNVNIYVPGGVDSISEALPVMVWFYGGGFLIGTTEMYPGEELAVQGDVIVVTVNYRVSVLGYLSTENNAAQGNYGLWDTVAALQYVQDNIAQFGGDPGRVTIFGQSAGGSTVSHLTLAPVAHGLFHRAIAMSGSARSLWAITGGARGNAINLGLVFGCPVLNLQAMVDCLKEKDPALVDLVGILSSVILGGGAPNWMPVIDGAFIPQDPELSLLEGLHGEYDFMAGHTYDDGAGVLLNPLGLNINLNIANNKEGLFNFLRGLFSAYGDADEILAATIERYPGLDSDDTEIRTSSAISMYTDFAFGSKSHYEADLHSSFAAGTSTYHYEFRYRQSFLAYPYSWVNGSHIDDIYSVMGEVFMKTFRDVYLGADFNDVDRQVSQDLIAYYANFAYTGNPNEGIHSVAEPWSQYNSASREFLLQGSTMVLTSHTPQRLDLYKYWNDLTSTTGRTPLSYQKDVHEEKILSSLKARAETLLERLQNMSSEETATQLLQEVFNDILHGRQPFCEPSC